MLSIHLGAHKTASTHLQVSLQQARPALAQAGIAYADPVQLRAMPLTDALRPDPGPEEVAAVRRELAAMAANQPHLLLSEENILGGTHRRNMFSAEGVLYPLAAARVAQVIALSGRGPATVFLALRDPAPFMVSAFALQVAHGHELEIGAYLGGRDPARSGWADLVARLRAVETVSRLVVWRYEDYRALRPRILGRMLGPELVLQVPEPPPSNVSMTQPGYEWFLSRAMSDSEIDLRVLARRARTRFSRADGHPPLRLLPDDVYARSALAYAADVAQVAAMAGVEFLAP